ncbi:autoinducer binding domain-containing protein [Burkholderia sp. F1]|uniref:autoinducer binding domain-containing protein n=1 Tax=Burkholderia sp. F1 TaxID=3366817 RepID=UPI003D75BA58
MDLDDQYGADVASFAEPFARQGGMQDAVLNRSDLSHGHPQHVCRREPDSWDRADNPQVLLDVALPLARDLGFQYVGYVFSTSLPVSSPRTQSISNFPAPWREWERARSTLECNPIIRRCRASVRPLVWDDTSFDSALSFRAALGRAGVRSGWSQLVRDGRGSWGVLTLGRTAPHPASCRPYDVEPRLVWLAQTFHYHLSRMCRTGPVGGNEIHLTEMEKTILRWTIDGKTSGELAMILDVSVRTVNFHVQNILMKMNTCNKTAAAAQAALLGLLY